MTRWFGSGGGGLGKWWSGGRRSGSPESEGPEAAADAVMEEQGERLELKLEAGPISGSGVRLAVWSNGLGVGYI